MTEIAALQVTFVDCLFLLLSHGGLIVWCVLASPEAGVFYENQVICPCLLAKVRTRCHCCKDIALQENGVMVPYPKQVSLLALPVTLPLHTLKGD